MLYGQDQCHRLSMFFDRLGKTFLADCSQMFIFDPVDARLFFFRQ